MRKTFDSDQKPRAVDSMTQAKAQVVASAPAQQPLPPPMGPYNTSGTVVDIGPDPRLPSCNTSALPVCSVSARPDAVAAHDNASTVNSPDETKLQEQKVEILNLRIQAIVKDCEIRRLKAEIEQLRVHAANTGVVC
ncbi:hypothetical protein G6011_11477 [Alternaria panax]|uniref:Uncharacterized protein n=1 Tax=Alternaria panax TaxID=48097 RepID=A0AAD4NRP7_9PLEO|nr:hypothetical protein G6011_11477 [Alternaria panax]